MFKQDYNRPMSLKLRLMLPIFAILLISTTTHGLTSLPCKRNQLKAFSDIVKQVSVIGSDERQTFDQYALNKGVSPSTVEKTFAATGVLACGDAQVTAQLTESSSVITTSGHFFKVPTEGCREMPTLKSKKCSFYTHDGSGWNVEHPVDVSSLQLGTCVPGQHDGDWAVLKLSKPAKGVKPYTIPGESEALSEPQKVINPVAFSDNFKVGGTYPRSLTECSIKNAGSLLLTDCDSGQGASGSANLKQERGSLKLIAITSYSEYGSEGWSNYSVPLTGDFYRAVREAAGKPARTASAKDKRDKGI